ncbi:Uncharacterized protein HZ326_5894 [Fusarium oxysporum f. sp. albedinis]|nr:Uncharacterized protein HZ326_5894 [Fusarium oxysporum f. sp. albedinis]
MKESGHQYESKVKSTLRLAHHAIFRIVLNHCERGWELPMRAGPGSLDKDSFSTYNPAPVPASSIKIRPTATG